LAELHIYSTKLRSDYWQIAKFTLTDTPRKGPFASSRTLFTMSLTEELTKLAALRQSGALTETEFQQAKAKLLGTPHEEVSTDTLDTLRRMKGPSESSLGEAANRYVSLQTITSVIGLLIFLFFFAPAMCRHSTAFGGNTIQLR
jgi:hypothetical protein